MKCADKDLLLYAVTDRYWLGERTLHDVVKESLDGGVTFVQLREKHLDQAHFLEEAKDLKMLCKAYNVPFVINDNVDIALEMDADGVHVGQSDMEAGDVRAKLGPDKIIGVSAQTVEQAVLAEKRGADYLGVGAVFPTSSKDDATEVSYEKKKSYLSGSLHSRHCNWRHYKRQCGRIIWQRHLRNCRYQCHLWSKKYKGCSCEP